MRIFPSLAVPGKKLMAKTAFTNDDRKIMQPNRTLDGNPTIIEINYSHKIMQIFHILF